MSAQKQPVHQERLGRVTAAVWQNQAENGNEFFSVTFSKIYHDGSAWNRTRSFSRGDLLSLAKLADVVDTWMHREIQTQRAEAEQQTEAVPF